MKCFLDLYNIGYISDGKNSLQWIAITIDINMNNVLERGLESHKKQAKVKVFHY